MQGKKDFFQWPKKNKTELWSQLPLLWLPQLHNEDTSIGTRIFTAVLQMEKNVKRIVERGFFKVFENSYFTSKYVWRSASVQFHTITFQKVLFTCLVYYKIFASSKVKQTKWTLNGVFHKKYLWSGGACEFRKFSVPTSSNAISSFGDSKSSVCPGFRILGVEMYWF